MNHVAPTCGENHGSFAAGSLGAKTGWK